ncbi:hypothetical protein [Streptomyces sp. NPDC020817]|uniref:hypothetical protein n=1 Tax=Streptomyces sp. NPDC020817 TaxID=3365095 RepID=UPI0037901E48
MKHGQAPVPVGAPDPGVGGHGDAQVAGGFEGRLLGEGGVATEVDGQWQVQHAVAGDALVQEGAERGGRRKCGDRWVLDSVRSAHADEPAEPTFAFERVRGRAYVPVGPGGGAA